MKSNVYLGAPSWESPPLDAAFYPEGMPEEWRLAYFNTQFSCVFLEAAHWRGQSPETLAFWAGETHEAFLFLLEGEGAPPPELQGRALLMHRDDPRLLWFDRATSLKNLSAGITGRAADAPLFLISGDGNLGRIEEVRTLLELLGF